ncbi:putative UMTA methyltransferase [Colletotrichum scovillei]|uniref:UMTA methyltransferase n=1 Tax=Colletotrichum scovillei TaxID=1209932 RepID=A0A9P7UD55_9PEZI|nr:putative UMTA methyltransferase [Colletotrichum scovillei]KAG7070716.1 putative UMTA methyltransferase [Colletotrichum scovillei]KAG7078956.1 putative UMTA methyltransferase [Colletotrichum scovillei]
MRAWKTPVFNSFRQAASITMTSSFVQPSTPTFVLIGDGAIIRAV